MLFSSTIFIFLFLPATLGAYYLARGKSRNMIQLLASLLFYAWGEPSFVLVMLLSITVNWLFGLATERNQANTAVSKAIVAGMLVFNLGILFVFKYLNFTVSNLRLLMPGLIPQTSIVLPLGISFFTFQAVSYVIDVYRKKTPAQRNLLNLGLYIACFPQLIAGPIVRYETVAAQIENRTTTSEDFSYGVKRFIEGLAKKVLIANTMAIIADKAFSVCDAGKLDFSLSWLGAVAYTFQIFFDFSGYSDMAIGLGRMFGFHFEENFNYPYISGSISEFWRRWHISLGTWFRDYVYFPLGGSRVNTKSRLVFNLFTVWLLTGIWHGANWNFFIWGLIYFVVIAFEKVSGYPLKFKAILPKLIYRVFSLSVIVFGWVIFRSKDFQNAVVYIKSMFGAAGNMLAGRISLHYVQEYWLFYLAALLLSAPLIPRIAAYVKGHGALFRLSRPLYVFIYAFIFLLAVSYLVVGAHNPFIYFNF